MHLVEPIKKCVKPTAKLSRSLSISLSLSLYINLASIYCYHAQHLGVEFLTRSRD